ncbi:MAG: ATP-grasp domain-containing protein [Kiloniellaceae bacterium]
MAAKEICVALTGFAGLDAPGPGVSVARALREGWRGKLALTAFGGDPLMPGAWLPGLIDRIYPLPPSDAGEDAFLGAVLKAHKERPFDAFVPGGDAVALTVARLRERLHALGIRTLLPSLDRLDALRPQKLARLLGDGRVLCPLTVVVAEPADLARQADQLGYPLHVRSWERGSSLVCNTVQAERAARRLASGDGAPLVLQRDVAGEKYGVAMVADAGGACTGMVIQRALALNSEGRSAAGVVVHDPDVARFARKVLEALDWRGPLQLVVVRVAGSKDLWLCNVHGHLPAWSMLCHRAGANLAVRLLEEMLSIGRKPKFRARAGTMYVRGIAETAIRRDEFVRLGRGKGVAGRPAGNGAAPNGRPAEGLRVALTGVSTLDVVNPGLGVARALRAADGIAGLYALAYGTLDSGAYQADLFDSTFRLPHNGSGEALLDRLKEIHRAQPFNVLIPCLDGELARFIGIADKLLKIGVHTLLPSRKSLKQRSKLALFGGKGPAERGGFAVPESVIARTKADTVKAVNALGVPAVVKGPVSQCIPVTCERDAQCAWLQLQADGAEAVIVQPQIAGPSYAISAVCDVDHRIVSIMTIKKLALCGRGSTWGAVHVEQPALEAAFAEFLRSIEWVGPVEGEFIRDELTDEFHLIEVNPRFTAWIYFSAALGSNQPYLAARMALGERVNPPANDKGLVFVRHRDEVPLRASDVAALSSKGALLHG